MLPRVIQPRHMIAMASAVLALAGCGVTGTRDEGSGRGRAPAAMRSGVAVEEIARVPMTRARSVAVAGDHAFVSRILDGMTAVDLRDVSAPRVAREFAPGEIQPLEIAADGTRLYIADRFRGLVVWDAARPDDPTSLSATPLPGIATGVRLARAGDRRLALVACGGAGLSVVDVTHPERPDVVGRWNSDTDYARSVDTHGSMAFLADNADGGLRVIDLSDLARPTLAGSYLMRGFAESARVSDGLLVAAWRTGGTRVFRLGGAGRDATTAPLPVCTVYRSRSRSHDAMVLGAPPEGASPAGRRLMAVADDVNGVDLYDIARPDLPLLVGGLDTEAAASGLAEFRGHLLAACWDAGLLVARISDGGR